jgi:alpha-tubulin suppressor-like RCC1 family protein
MRTYYCPNFRLPNLLEIPDAYETTSPFVFPASSGESGPHLHRIEGKSVFVPRLTTLPEAERINQAWTYDIKGRSSLLWKVVGNARSAGEDGKLTVLAREASDRQGVVSASVTEWTGSACASTQLLRGTQNPTQIVETLVHGALSQQASADLEAGKTYCVILHTGGNYAGLQVRWDGAAATVMAATTAADATALTGTIYATPPGVASWGTSDVGQLGIGIATERPTAVTAKRGTVGDVDLPTRTADMFVRDVAAGEAHVVAAMSDGSVWTWGKNDKLQLGDTSTGWRARPAQITGVSSVLRVAAGDHFSLALDQNGDVWAWGDNEYCQLAQPCPAPSTTATPSKIAGLSNISSIAAGKDHGLALGDDGRVYAWGYNPQSVPKGALGICNDTTDRVPQPATVKTDCTSMTPLNGVRAIAASIASFAIVDQPPSINRQVWGWGPNSSGQLGVCDQAGRQVPTAVLTQCSPSVPLSEVLTVSAATFHALAIKDGTPKAVYNWGSGAPVAGVASQFNLPGSAEAIAAGTSGTQPPISELPFNLALVRDGNGQFLGRAWGNNNAGQLGGVIAPPETTTVINGLVPTGREVANLAAGTRFSLARYAPTTIPVGPVTLLTPINAAVPSPVVFRWRAHPGATKYRVYVSNPPLTAWLDKVVTALEAGCQKGGICQLKQPADLPFPYCSTQNGWWVQPMNAVGMPTLWAPQTLFENQHHTNGPCPP